VFPRLFGSRENRFTPVGFVARGHPFPDHALAVPTAERRGSTRDAAADGVSHLVTNGDSSAPVPDAAVHALRARRVLLDADLVAAALASGLSRSQTSELSPRIPLSAWRRRPIVVFRKGRSSGIVGTHVRLCAMDILLKRSPQHGLDSRPTASLPSAKARSADRPTRLSRCHGDADPGDARGRARR
jgi:hypothetical protein